MNTRRDFLKKAALFAGGSAMAGSVPSSILKAMSINPEPGSTYLDAEHVVVLMQENRSFDHCFGTLRGVRGFNDPRAVTLPNKNLVWLQSNKQKETFAPFHFDLKDSKATWMGDVPHSRSSQVDASNGGKHDNWIDAKRSGHQQYRDIPLTMGYYTREDLPFNYAMADAFTVCDQNFCSAMTSTWPNRLYLWGGTIREEKNDQAKAYIRNNIPWGEARWKTFPERLEENKISWRVYQNDLSTGGGYQGEERAWLANFGCNPLEFLSQYNIRFSKRYVQGIMNRVASLPEEISKLEERLRTLQSSDDDYEKVKVEIQKKKDVLADSEKELEQYSKERYERLSQYQKNLHEKAFTTNSGDPEHLELETLKYTENGVEREMQAPKGDVLHQFRKDVDEGKLPTVSWLVPSQNLSDHPSAPWYGAWYVSEILDILTKNPEVWKKTIFILTYDENDGYFDHVPPFVAPDFKDPETGKCSPGVNETGVEYVRLEKELEEGLSEKAARGGPIGLGFRVPMIIASPWSRGGKVCSQVFDHTSSIQFLETFLNQKFGKNIYHDNISEWRRAVCGDLTSAFTQYNGEEVRDIPFLDRDPFLGAIHNAQFKKEPTNYRKLSSEEIAKFNREPHTMLVRQEEGTRKANAIPYELYAEGGLSEDRKKFEIRMKAGTDLFGEKSAGAPFIVYAMEDYLSAESERNGRKTFETGRNWHFAVKAGDTLKEEWPLSSFSGANYHLRLYGPNGFYREFAGSSEDPAVEIRSVHSRSGRGGNNMSKELVLKLRNRDKNKNYEAEVRDEAYGGRTVTKTVALGEEIEILLDQRESHGWYDLSVRIKGNSSFLRKLAGRIETGEESYSDPQMA